MNGKSWIKQSKKLIDELVCRRVSVTPPNRDDDPHERAVRAIRAQRAVHQVQLRGVLAGDNVTAHLVPERDDMALQPLLDYVAINDDALNSARGIRELNGTAA